MGDLHSLEEARLRRAGYEPVDGTQLEILTPCARCGGPIAGMAHYNLVEGLTCAGCGPTPECTGDHAWGSIQRGWQFCDRCPATRQIDDDQAAAFIWGVGPAPA